MGKDATQQTKDTLKHTFDEVFEDNSEKAPIVEPENDAEAKIATNKEELSNNINRLIDQIEDSDELKHILVDREQNKLISKKTLERMRSRDLNKNSFTPYEGTLENLLELAKYNDTIAEAIEINPERMMLYFDNIYLRYALIKENPANHASLIHFEFDIAMPEIEEKIAAEKKRVDDLNNTQEPTRRWQRKKKKTIVHEYNFRQFRTHSYNVDSLIPEFKNAAARNKDSYWKIFSEDNALHMVSRNGYYDTWKEWVSGEFDSFGNIRIFPTPKKYNERIRLMDWDV